MTMKDKSTMGLTEYVVSSFIFELVFWIYYRLILFRNIQGLTYTQSKYFLFLIIIFSFLVCTFIIFSKKKKFTTIMVHTMISYGIYTIYAYKRSIIKKVNVILLIAFIICAIYAILLFKKKILSKNKKLIIKNRISIYLMNSITIVSILLSTILVPMLIESIFDFSIFKPTISAKQPKSLEEKYFLNNLEILSKIQESKWDILSSYEKLDVLQCLANIEALRLGLPNELNVVAINTDDNLKACYNDDTSLIKINIGYLEMASAKDVVTSCCHEAYHSYERKLVDAYNLVSDDLKKLDLYKDIALYKTEFNNYKKLSKDYNTYYSLRVEKDARSYGNKEMIYYFSKVSKYLEK